MPAKAFGYSVGVVYAIVGVVGFAWTGFEHWIEATGPELLWFQLNPTHNLAHLLVGVALMWAGASAPPVARLSVLAVGMVLLGLGVAGFWLTGAPDWNVLALDTADNWLHIATAALAIVAGLAPTRAPQPTAGT